MNARTYIVQLAAHKLPRSEVAYIRDFIVADEAATADKAADGGAGGGGSPLGEGQIRMMVAMNRLSNPICNRCRDKSDPDKLSLCPHCCSTWYCGTACRDSDAPAHALWCCKEDAPRDMGPMATQFLRGSANEP